MQLYYAILTMNKEITEIYGRIEEYSVGAVDGLFK